MRALTTSLIGLAFGFDGLLPSAPDATWYSIVFAIISPPFSGQNSHALLHLSSCPERGGGHRRGHLDGRWPAQAGTLAPPNGGRATPVAGKRSGCKSHSAP